MPTKPEVPVRGYSFTDYQALNPVDPLPGAQVDIEFDRGYSTDADFLEWLSVSIADDGSIRAEALGNITGEAVRKARQVCKAPTASMASRASRAIPVP